VAGVGRIVLSREARKWKVDPIGREQVGFSVPSFPPLRRVFKCPEI